MDDLLTIGVFGRRCGLSASALRFYAECGLCRPVAVDEVTGYRYYTEAQIAEAVLVRRLRAADMTVDAVRQFLAGDPQERRRLLESHAAGLEQHVEALRRSVDELRSFLRSEPSERSGGVCVVPAAELAAGLAQVQFAVSADGSRPELGGVWVEVREDALRLVATDSYRLAVRDLVMDDPVGVARLRGLVSRGAVEELQAVLDATPDAAVSLHQRADGGLAATVDATVVELGRDGGGFPDYQQLLDGLPAGHRGVVGRRRLIEALTAVAGGTAQLTFRSDTLDVVAGVRHDSMPTAWDGPPQQVTVNPAFLAEALRNLVGPDVVVEVADNLRPVVLRSADTGTLTVWTMPVRTDG